MTERVSVAIDDGVASVAMNRPDKHNAVDMDMFRALTDTGLELAADPSVRVIVLSGNGDNFCSGIDVSVFAGGGIAAQGENLMAPVEGSPANVFQRAAWVWQEVPVPVIAALKGVVYGAGLQIALGADMRISRADARLAVMEIKWGIIPDMSLTATARNLVPVDQLKELAMTGRIFDGAEALGLGLVTRLDDAPEAAAAALARDIANRSPDAVRAIKSLLNQSWQQDVAGSLALEASLQTSVMGGANQFEAVAANLQKRAPAFKDPES